MVLKVINAYNTIDPETETHYAYYTTVFNTAQYPQVHDFYEIALVTDGSLRFTMGERILNLPAGSLLWVRPGDVHSKALPENGAHINLAFPAGVVNNLFEFLYDKKIYHDMMSRSYCPPVELSPAECRSLQQKMTSLSMIPPDRKTKIRTQLRLLLAEIVNSYLVEVFHGEKEKEERASPPLWLREALADLERLSNLTEGTDFLRKSTGKTKEHICRSFRKYLNATPSDYIYSLRLNYVANMLLHSDREILDLAYEAGFENISYFYKKFKQAFHVSPRKFREKNETG
ncbi:MAG: AraC family transcriptional regulator [Treponema sp.]|jgi:AraC family cel operon transcriptional repressor|nr:AraC family transcriptional regulator [Treponema sp.]